MKRPLGIVSGYVLKLARESAGLTQQQLADALDVTRAGVQSWESSRRPLGAMSVQQMLALRSRLIRYGASPVLVSILQIAQEADYQLGHILDAATSTDASPDRPLGQVVLTHSLAEMIAWPITRKPPHVLQAATAHEGARRRGPVPDGPTISADERLSFFAGLLRVAEDTGRHPNCSACSLAHRQAVYLASLDPTGASVDQMRSSRSFTPRSDHWTTEWPGFRSQVVALARLGDPEPLRAFIDSGAEDPLIMFSTLNYHAYWVGEFSDQHRSDDFMTAPPSSWRGVRLLQHLSERLQADHGFVDLNVHTLWLLFKARSELALEVPEITQDTVRNVEDLLSTNSLSQRSRREASDILHDLRMIGTSI